MTKTDEVMFRMSEAAIADFGNNIAGAIELVAIVKRPGGAGTVVSNLDTIEETIDRLKTALGLAFEAKRQLDAGVAEMMDDGPPPTAH